MKMGKKILMFGDIETENISFTAINFLFLEDVDIDDILVSNIISFSEKNINSLVTCMITIKPKQNLMVMKLLIIKRFLR